PRCSRARASRTNRTRTGPYAPAPRPYPPAPRVRRSISSPARLPPLPAAGAGRSRGAGPSIPRSSPAGRRIRWLSLTRERRTMGIPCENIHNLGAERREVNPRAARVPKPGWVSRGMRSCREVGRPVDPAPHSPLERGRAGPGRCRGGSCHKLSRFFGGVSSLPTSFRPSIVRGPIRIPLPRVAAMTRTHLAGASIALATVAAFPAGAMAQAGPLELLYDSAYFAWDARDYPPSLRQLDRLLATPGSDEFVVRAAELTGEAYRSTELAVDGRALRWSADGRVVGFESGTGGERAIHVFAVDADEPRRLLHHAGYGL